MIVTRKLGKTYPEDVQALVDVSIAIPQGDFMFLVGPNGAGKTTLFKLLTREEEPSSGAILFHGRNVVELSRTDLSEHRRALGAVFQDARLVATKTVLENVLFPLEADGKPAEKNEQQALDALKTSDLEDLADRFPGDLSGGQQQKVAIARALANDPQAILADEPTGNLSPAATDEIMKVFDRINRRGITVVIATHNYDVVDGMGRRVLAIDAGRVVSDSQHSGYPGFLRKAA